MSGQKIIRKISVGPDYFKSMSFSVDQRIVGGKYLVHGIRFIGEDTYEIDVINPETDEVYLYKKFKGMPISIEYNIEY